MRFLAVMALAVTLGLSIPFVNTANSTDYGTIPKQEHVEMLYPTVLVRVGRAGSGSGTVIYSKTNEENEYESYVLTNWHVVRNNINVREEWHPDKKERIEKETRRPVQVDLWEYNNYSTEVGTVGRIANIVAYDKGRDLALLKIEDTERKMPYVATLYPENEDDGPWLFSQVYAVGAGLGKPPFPTMGLLSGYSRDLEGNALYLASAPIIFGNSGGAGYVLSIRGTYEVIGVPSMVSGYGWGNVVTHMGWWRPISEIRIFLRAAGYGERILGDKPIETTEE